MRCSRKLYEKGDSEEDCNCHQGPGRGGGRFLLCVVVVVKDRGPSEEGKDGRWAEHDTSCCFPKRSKEACNKEWALGTKLRLGAVGDGYRDDVYQLCHSFEAGATHIIAFSLWRPTTVFLKRSLFNMLIVRKLPPLCRKLRRRCTERQWRTICRSYRDSD